MKFYFGAVRKLFSHLETDRIIERSPFAGLAPARQPCHLLPPRTLEALKEFLQDLDGIEEGENGIWTPDGKIAVDFEDPESAEAVVNMVLIIGCAAGRFRRLAVTGEQPMDNASTGSNIR